MSRIAVIGAGYVGLTTAACLVRLGHDVCCADPSEERIAKLLSGEIPIVEDGLSELVQEGLSEGRLAFVASNIDASAPAEFIFLCVPTPQGDDGRADMSVIKRVASEIGPHLRSGAIVVNKSTAPVGSTRVVESILERPDVAVASNPEFLREGSAVHDFLNPDRIVIGTEDEAIAVKVSALFKDIGAPVVVTDPATAETIKYASNAFLATKVSFVNAIAALCEAIGADVRQVVLGMGYDKRIGSDFLHPGPGWGGSCLPKDTAALLRIADDAGYDFHLLRGVISVNEKQYDRVVEKAHRITGGSLRDKSVALWGLTFKAGTDDLRGSPALEVARRLLDCGASVHTYDPTIRDEMEGITLHLDPYSACKGASVLIVTTEWDEFRWLDFERVGQLMDARAIVDARNLLDSAMLRRLDFTYEGIGLP